MSSIVKALYFASKVHSKQIRMYSKEPYINHCIRVSNNSLVMEAGEEAICIALMHDCIEDSDRPEEAARYIKDNFSALVYETCLLLTHDSKKESYQVYRQRILTSENTLCKVIKYADSLDNSVISESMPEKFIYRCEKYYKNAQEYLTAYENKLKNVPSQEDIEWDNMISLLARKRTLRSAKKYASLTTLYEIERELITIDLELDKVPSKYRLLAQV